VILTEAAAERLGLQTTRVMNSDGRSSVTGTVPYGSVLYDASGATWVYTVLQPLTYMRHAVSVASIEEEVAYHSAGPPAGTEVVSVGAAELFGTELKIDP
jgi:hypothetical protein